MRTPPRRSFGATGLLAAALLAALTPSARAGEADVVAARLTPMGEGLYRLEATVRHADEGWDHYADAFEAVAPDGTVLGLRELLHPHVEEQPFTRSLSGLRVPAGVDEIVVRARDSVHGHGGATVTLTVPRD